MAATAVVNANEKPSLIPILALVGAISPPLFVIVFLVLGLIKPHYDAMTQTVSEGSLGALGWVQILNFLMMGATMLMLSLALWQTYGDRFSARIGSALIGLTGIAMLGSAVFLTDPLHSPVVTSHGVVHRILGSLTFLAFAIAAFVFAKRFWSNRGFAIYSIVTGVLVPVGFFSIGPSGRPGLVQRLVIIIVFAWITVLALLTRTAARRKFQTNT